jgi:secreted trypsin-like serine protease
LTRRRRCSRVGPHRRGGLRHRASPSPSANFGDGPGILCSGTLIAPKVFLTASHCTDFLPSLGIGPSDVWVTFDPTFDAASPLIGGTYHTNPQFAQGGFSDTHDIAVITLDRAATGIAPARLPTQNLLESVDKKTQRFVDSWLKLSMNPSIGSGGTCFGDSGGPHFLGTTNIVVSLSVTGDRFCRSTDVTYRTDTESARSFLQDFVSLP